MRVLVTGGAGYIGTHLLKILASKGAQCFAIDNLSRGLAERIGKDTHFEQIDLTDSDSLTKYLKGRSFDAIFHLAGLMQARESGREPKLYWKNNLEATQILLRAIDSTNIGKFIFSSSCSVYGNNQNVSESSELNPISIYAKSKLSAERELQNYFKGTNNLTIFRFFNVIGCNESPFSCDIQRETLLPATARRLIEGNGPIIYGGSFDTSDGSSIRDYVDVRDLVNALVIPLETQLLGVHNIASNNPKSTLEVVKTLLDISKLTNRAIEIVSSKVEDPAIITAQSSSALINFGWNTNFSLTHSIKSFWSTFERYYLDFEV